MNASQLVGQARFRVMARNRSGDTRLISLAVYREDAVDVARRYCQSPPDDITAVVVEKWFGLLTEGRWKSLEPRNGGFAWRRPLQGAISSSLPRSGEMVKAVLQTAKTRKGGWVAKLADRELNGPVTNSNQCPSTFACGQTVMLRVEAISQRGDRIQFRWVCEA